MSFKEVNSLRKSGNLEQAMAMAQDDLDRNRDQWSCSAMFWCLNDKAKSQSGSELAETIGQMESLAEDMTPGDSLVINTLARLRTRMVPHADKVREAAEMAKSDPSLARRAYDTVAAFHDAGELDSSQHENFGWIIYRALHADHSGDVRQRKVMLLRYLKLDVPRPSLLHSLILGEAAAIERATPLQFLFSGFLNMWKLENLRDDDWQASKSSDGHRFPSLVERVITLYVKEMNITPQVISSDDFIEIVDKALERFPDNEQLPRQKALMLIRTGRTGQAVDFYKNAILQDANKFYLWAALAAVVHDTDLKIALLCRALSMNNPPEMTGKTRMHLASLLCDRQQWQLARCEIDKVIETYTVQGWKISDEMTAIRQRIPAGTVAGDNRQFYADNAAAADQFIFDSLPSVVMVKVGEHSDNRQGNNGKVRKIIKWILVDSNGKNHFVNPRRLRLQQRAGTGQCFEVKMRGRDVVWARSIQAPQLTWLRRVTGTVSLKTNSQGKPYGFVENCYIPASIAKTLTNGATVTATALERDGRWQCIAIDNKGD